MADEPSMTVAKLIQHLSRFPQDAEVVELDVSVVIDQDANLVQSLSLWEADDDGDDDPDDGSREEVVPERDRKVVDLPPRRGRP